MSIARVTLDDDQLEKIAASPESIKQNLLYMGIGGAIQPALSGITSGIQKIYNHINKNKTWAEIKKRHPELDTEENQERFEAMFDMSPSVMKHVTFAVPSLRSATEYGTGGVPIDLAGKLVNIDAQKSKKPDMAQGIMSGAMAGLGAAQKERQMAQATEQFAAKQDLSERTLGQKIDAAQTQAEQFGAKEQRADTEAAERRRQFGKLYAQREQHQRESMIPRIVGVDPRDIAEAATSIDYGILD